MELTNVIVVMGVCGSGKTTVGKALANKLGWKFEDGDDWQPKENIFKMSKGQSLTDEDRQPWLKALSGLISKWVENMEGGVLACSALRRCYRRALVGTDLVNLRVVFVHLTGSKEVIIQRMRSRSDHFMPVSLLDSQFHTLELPDAEERAITCDITCSVDEIVDTVVKKIVPCKKN